MVGTEKNTNQRYDQAVSNPVTPTKEKNIHTELEFSSLK